MTNDDISNFFRGAPIQIFRGEYAFLSNFYAAPIIWDSKAYATSEAAYQAAKTLDPNMKEKIRLASSPVETKRLGRKLEMREDWDSVKLEIMASIVSAKFSQSHVLAKRLIATGSRPLRETNDWGDTFWGINQEGEGQNHLGHILEAVRNRLA